MQDLVTMVCGAGIVFWLTESQMGSPVRWVFTRVRFFDDMFACPFCTGFWVGIGIFALDSAFRMTANGLGPFNLGMVVWAHMYWALFGMGTGIVSMVVLRAIDMCEAVVYSSSMLPAYLPLDHSALPEIETPTQD